MQRSQASHWKAVLAVTLPVVLLVYVHVRAHIALYRVGLGMPRAAVIELLGAPDKSETTLIFCDGYFDWSGACPDQEYAEFLFFRKGIDRWIVIGIAADGRVAYKTMGDI